MKTLNCECSRCRLYLRGVTSELGDLDYRTEQELKGIEFEDRKYQTQLIEYGKNHNIMACLPTGSGKTFIALKLILHYSTEILKEKKKVFFLANTIPLVNQQAAFIARNSIFKVRHLTGDMDVDYWSQEKWDVLIEEFDVMAMTTQIFLNMLRHEYIRLSKIALLIFDECHHATEKHPMAEVMKEYARAKQMDSLYPVPRVLGLSATIIKGSCKPDDVSKKIEELEGRMQSIAITYKDYEEVMVNATSSTIFKQSYPKNENFLFDDGSVNSEMEQFSRDLQEFRKERQKAKLGTAKLAPGTLDPQLRTFDNVFNLLLKKPSPGDLKVALDDVLHTYRELGMYCTVLAINLRVAYIKFCLMDVNDERMKKWYNTIMAYLLKLRTKIQGHMELHESDAARHCQTFISPKMKKLLEILLSYKQKECGQSCQDDRLCGLIFTDRRATAQVLAWYLKDLAEQNKEEFGFILVNFCVGTSRSAFESVETRVYARKQTETINRFRNKELNLLTATSVLEEGIDVPSCNLVVRFDPISTYTSFIQSMGRARKKGAKFYTLLPEEKFYDLSTKLDTFQAIYDKIIVHLRRNVTKIDADNYTTPSSWEADLIAPICPGGTIDSPKITMDSAGEIVDRYCMLLPTDGIATSQSLSWWNEMGSSTGFKAFLKLPLNSVLKTAVEGREMSSKSLAQQAVYMRTCQLLLEAGCFDDKLIPVHPTLSTQIESFFKSILPYGTVDGAPPAAETVNVTEEAMEIETEEGEVTESTVQSNAPTAQLQEEQRKSRIKEWFLKRQPKVLNVDTPPKPGRKVYCYKIGFQLQDSCQTSSPWKNLYNLDNAFEAFGLITNQTLPDIGTFPLFGIFGTMHCSLKLIRLTEDRREFVLDERRAAKLRYIQHRLFSDFLGMGHYLLENAKTDHYVITPLVRGREGWKLYDHYMEEHFSELDSIHRTRPPQRGRMDSIDRKRPRMDYSKYQNAVVFPWYKKGAGGKKTPYLVDCIEETMTPLSPFHDGNHSTYRNFLEKEHNVDIRDLEQNMLKCKLAGIKNTQSTGDPTGKSPIQLNYLLEKYSKEDEFPVYLVPELVFSVSIPASLIVQLKLLPSTLHRISRLLIVHEFFKECAATTGWPEMDGLDANDAEPLGNELNLLSIAHQAKKEEEAERRKERLKIRNEKIAQKKQTPNEKNKQHIEQRELHYEFIHPNRLTDDDIRLFHEAVSMQHSAKKITLKSTEYEAVVDSNLSCRSTIKLLDKEELDLDPIEQPLDNGMERGPALLSLMEAVSLRLSNEGVAVGRYQHVGASFLNFATSLFAFCNYPKFGEPLLCQLRNRLVSFSILHELCKKKGLPEILSGSDFHPNDCWIPPGKEIRPEYIGEILARDRMHHSVLDELVTVQRPPPQHHGRGRGRGGGRGQPRQQPTLINRLKEMNRTEVEAFINRKAVQKIFAPNTVATATASDPANRQKKSTPFIVGHSTFTHTEMSIYDIVSGLHSVIGSFFVSNGPAGAYTVLDWFDIRGPADDGSPQNLKIPADVTPHQNSAIRLPPLSNPLFCQFESLEAKIQYRFNNKDLLIHAFTHPSYPGVNVTDCYQRLEFIGDSILDLLLTNYIYTQPPDDNQKRSEDDLRNIRAALVNSVTYASLAVRYEFNKYLLSMSKPLMDMIDNFVVLQESVEHEVVGYFTLVTDEECRGPKHIEVPKVLCDIFEALAGAIYLDSGKSLDEVWKVYYRLMQPEIDVFWTTMPKAPIQQLTEEMKKENIEVNFSGYTGKKTQARSREMVRVAVGPYGHYFGQGTNRQRAKEAAAKLALKLIKAEAIFVHGRDATRLPLLTC